MHVFFHAIKEEKGRKNAKKSVSENVFCLCDRCYHGSCVCVLQLVRCEWKTAYELGRGEQCHPGYQCLGRSVYVWKDAPDMGCDPDRVLFCICLGKSVRKSTVL